MSEGPPFRVELPGKFWLPSVEELAEPRKPVTWIWGNRIPAKKVTVLAGAGGTGKSTLLVGLAVARATRRSFLGVATMPGVTAFVSAEDDAPDYLRRFDAWRSITPTLDLDAVSRNFAILPLVGMDTRIVRSKFGTYDVAYEVVDDLAAKALAINATMIVFETASRFGAGESNEASAALVSACERLARQTSAAVVIVTHSGKDAARNRRQDQYAARGGSALVDNARSALVLTSPFEKKEKKKLPIDVDEEEEEVDDDRLILTARKVNDSAPVPDLMIEKVPTPFGLTMRVASNGRQSPAEIEAFAKATAKMERERAEKWIASVKRAVTKLAAEGIEITATKLRDEYKGMIPDVPTKKVTEIVQMAIAAKAIFPGERKTRGGGFVLLPEAGFRDSGTFREDGSPVPESFREPGRVAIENGIAVPESEALSGTGIRDAGSFDPFSN